MYRFADLSAKLRKNLEILGNFKIDDLGENEIVLKVKKTKIKIFGSNLKIVTFAKGEVEIAGNIDGVVKL